MEAGEGIQKRTRKLFSGYFARKILAVEIIQSESSCEKDVDHLLSLLRMEAENLNIPLQSHITHFLNELVSHMLQLSEPKLPEKTVLWALLGKFVTNGGVQVADIQAIVQDADNLAPARLIVELDKLGVISLISYFQNTVDDKEKSQSWVTSLLKLIPFEGPVDEVDQATFHYLFAAIVHIGFGTHQPGIKIGGQALKIAVLVVNKVIKKIWEYLWVNPEKEIHCFEIPSSSSLSPHFSLQSFQNCYLEQLAFLVSHKPEIKASKAINLQHEWTFFKSPKNVASLITQLLIPLEVEKVVEKLDDILNRYEINWKTLLLVVSAVQICYPAGNKHLRALVVSLLQKALDNLQTDLLLGAFLLARQINAESTSGIHYGVWFSSITSSTTTSKQFTFLMKFLSSIARHEPAWVLMAHRNNAPHIPLVDNCRSLWTDYIALIRTRIEDLKTKPREEDVIEEDIAVMKEVESAIGAYEKSGRIPNSVVEASIFSKPYFINKFLPTLLKPRRIPEPLDVREDFINDLRQSGKLPLSMYEAYTTACRQLDQPTPMEVDVSSDVSTDPSDIFKQLVHCRGESKRSALLSRVEEVLVKVVTPTEHTTIQFDSDQIDRVTDEASFKIVDCWIESFQSALAAGGMEDSSWMNGYFLLLCPHSCLIRALYCRVWQFISKHVGSDEAVRCYGSIIFLLRRDGHLLVPIQHGTFTGDFTDWLNGHLDLRRKDSMLFHLRLLHAIVTLAKSFDDLSSVTETTILYLWLCRRVSHSNTLPESPSPLLHVDVPKMTIEEWLKLEVNVEPDKDVLRWPERSSYLLAVLESDYRNDSVNLARVILTTLVQQAMKSSGKTSGRMDCSQDLLQLLQACLSESQPRARMSSQNRSWLVEYWIQLRSEHGANVDELMWNFICSLPANLLCPPEAPVRMLTDLIEDDWRNTMTEGAWLPKHVTAHLLRALEGSKELPSCLQFSKQIHNVGGAGIPPGRWRMLDSALKVFHPRSCQLESVISWTGDEQMDLLVCQLMMLSAASHFEKNWKAEEWPWFVKQLGSRFASNVELLSGSCTMAGWTGHGVTLPWKEILPSYLIHLLPYVVLHLLLLWADALVRKDLSTAVAYLETLLSVHADWMQITDTFVESLTVSSSQADYPAGKLLDLHASARLNSRIEKILISAPLRAVKSLLQSSGFHRIDADFQAVVKQRQA